MTLLYIVAAALAGGLLSVGLAALLAWKVQPRLIPVFVSYAVGALLGVVFLDLLPHIFETTTDYQAMAAWILAGIMGFFVLEKMVLWRHSHDHGAGLAEHVHKHGPEDQGQGAGRPHVHSHLHGHAHAGDTGTAASAWMVIVGDGFHNFTDGLAIASAFVADVRLGVLTSIAIVAHELPQELGNFLILMHAGFTRMRALFWNIASSAATLVGAVAAYFVLQALQQYASLFLCLAAASMIYVAIADLIPGLHRRTGLRETVQQLTLIAAGIGSIYLVHTLIGH